MFLKVSPSSGTLEFGEKAKLSWRNVRPFEIKNGIGNVTYKLQLPPELSGVHDIYHVSTLKKYVEDPTHVLYHEPLDIQPDTSYIEKPIAIIDTK